MKSANTNLTTHTRRHARRGGDEALLALGSLLRETRVAAELGQDELSLAAGVSRDTIIALESGRPGVSLGKASQVLRSLGLTLRAGPRA